MVKIVFVIIILSPVLAVAQRYANIQVFAYGKSVPYYSVNLGDEWLVADSLGTANIPEFWFGKKFNIHTLAKDTVVTTKGENLNITLNGSFNLSEVKVFPNLKLSSLKKVTTSVDIFNSFGYATVRKYPVEHGKFYEIGKAAVLESYRVKIENEKFANQTVLLNIYSVDEKGSFIPIEPQRISLLKAEISKNKLLFDIAQLGIVLLPKGKYFFVVELLPTTNNITVSFNEGRTSNTLMRIGKGKWFRFKTPDHKQVELISELKYRELLDGI